ncbi:uncharacterized protein PHACADRAFT_260933 [Phanerochaete carnosa HHB-10118-sp]|uniref:Uncharacterized protein n=1 Tax=Phanerochaete carnosa (strain HHB-10118-sp) TaxID=650164 RepID=K5URH0_PHACS|nr:uncharacterized protein PHACADRAFT_260933 [Phanerochaete carnosa HHB-10118-sp]EKM52486.1 hypothetical protein PHACADRAFT_260933 [Phanerochaete carnosa HHB-10118-sp]
MEWILPGQHYILAYAYAVFITYVCFEQIITLVHPFQIFAQSVFLAFGVVLSFVTWISELVLLLRLVAVFPIQLTGRKTLLAIMAFPVAVKLVRLACLVCYYVQFSEVAPPYGNNVLTIQDGPANSPFIKVNWTLEIFDNGCVLGSIIKLAFHNCSLSVVMYPLYFSGVYTPHI